MACTQVDLYMIQIQRDIRVTDGELWYSNSVSHSLLSTSNISRRHPIHELTSMQFGLNSDSEGYLSQACDLLSPRSSQLVWLPCRSYTRLWYSSKSESSPNYIEVDSCACTFYLCWKFEKGMLYRVRVTQLNLCDSDTGCSFKIDTLGL